MRTLLHWVAVIVMVWLHLMVQGTHAQDMEGTSAGGIPIKFELDQPRYITLAIDNAEGRRVRNLMAETRLPAGEHQLIWDGYDDEGKLVPPGTYQAKGLTHEGIRLFYEFSFNTAGNPPWHTADHRGAWMADHSQPSMAVFLPAGSSPYGDGMSQVALGSIVAECGDPTIFVDLTGQRLHGEHYFGWDGAVAAARDVTARGKQDIFVYLLMGWEGKRLQLRGINQEGKGVTLLSIDTQNAMPREPAGIGIAMAIHDGLAVVSLPMDDELVFVDLATKAIKSRVKLSQPKGVWFDSKGELTVISGDKVKVYRVDRSGAEPTLVGDRTVVSQGLENPYALVRDDQGAIYVSDQGKSHQVKVFSANGQRLRVIGKPGGLQLGLYDEERMQVPQALSIDDKGQLWVAEYDHMPRRVSIWNAQNGKLVKALYGPPKYGGGGTIDPMDKTRAFYAQYGGLMEWELDWEKGTAKPKAINVRRELMGTPEEMNRWQVTIPERPLRIKGRTYLVPTFSGFLRWNDNLSIYLLGDDHIAWPVAYVGTMRRWKGNGYDGLEDVVELYAKHNQPDFLTIFNDTVVAWSDRNFDHKIQTEEFSHRQFPELSITVDGKKRRLNRKEMTYCLPDLSMTFGWNMWIDPPVIDSRGVPHYKLSTMRALVPPKPEYGGNEEGWGGPMGPDGTIFTGFVDAVDKQGKKIWSYPVADASKPPQKGGEMHEPTRLLGPIETAKVGQAGHWYAINGERGNIFLMTTDGLFIQALGGHMAVWPLMHFPKAERGMLIDSPEAHISFEAEHFHPTITQTKDGEIYLVAGKEHCSIFRVDGFENITRMSPTPVQVSAQMLAGLPTQKPRESENPHAHKLPVLVSSKPMKLDGELDEWGANTIWVKLDARASAAVRVVGDTMYAAYRTGDENAIVNDASDPKFLFKYGGALDLQIRPENLAAGFKHVLAQDRRLLVANVRGKMTAMLYYPETDRLPEHQRVLFESPIGKVRFDQVMNVSNQVRVAGSGGNFEVAIPLKLLGFPNPPRIGQEALADIGIIRGDGHRNIQRLYWHNTDTLLVSDVPSEARLQPANWGRFQFVADQGLDDDRVLLAPDKARRVGSALQLKELPGKEFSIGFWSNASDFLQWNQVPVKPGDYTIELTYGSGNRESNEFILSIARQNFEGKTQNTGGWTTYTTVPLGQVKITTDRIDVTLRAKTAEGGLMDFKALNLIPVKP